MDAIEDEARRRGLRPNAMLDKIVDDWFQGVYPAPHVEEKDKPWYLE